MILVFSFSLRYSKIYLIPQFRAVLDSAKIDFALSKTTWNEIIQRGMKFFLELSNIPKIDRTLKNLIDIDNTTLELQIAKRKVQKFQHKKFFPRCLGWHGMTHTVSLNIFVKTNKKFKTISAPTSGHCKEKNFEKNEAKQSRATVPLRVPHILHYKLIRIICIICTNLHPVMSSLLQMLGIQLLFLLQ